METHKLILYELWKAEKLLTWFDGKGVSASYQKTNTAGKKKYLIRYDLAPCETVIQKDLIKFLKSLK